MCGKIASDSGELLVATHGRFARSHPLAALPRWWFLSGAKLESPGIGRKGFENLLSKAITKGLMKKLLERGPLPPALLVTPICWTQRTTPPHSPEGGTN